MDMNKWRVRLFSTVLLSMFSTSPLADSADLKFQSVVSAISQTDSTAGTITVSIHGLDLAVTVNGDTEINESGEEVGLASVSAGDFVEINSFLSDQGIVADEINVLDERNQQFRFRGLITATDSLVDSTIVTLLGTEIAANTSTEITRRGVGGGNSIPASELAVGDTINVRGGLVDGVLVASRLHVGTREPGSIELDGKILSVADSLISIQLESGGAFNIVIDANTVINGELIIGAIAEVEGQLNTDISLIAFKVAVDVDGDGDADDDYNSIDNNDGKIEIGAEIKLRSNSSNYTGKVETSYKVRNSEVEQNFEVEVEDGAPGTIYSIVAFFSDTSVDFGTITANIDGEASIEFETEDGHSEQSQLSALLPEGLDVRDITSVQIVINGDVILEGTL